MRILFVTSTYPTPYRPSQGCFNRVLVDSLRESDEIRVIAPVPWPQLRHRPVQAIDHVASRWSAVEEFFPVYYYPPKIWRHHYHHFYWYSIRGMVRQLAKNFQPEIVVGYWLHPDGSAAVRAAKLLGVPAIVMSGGSDLRLLTKSEQRAKEIRRALEAAERVIVFSRDLARCAQRLGVPDSKVDVLYRGVDGRIFHAVERRFARRYCGLCEEDVVLFWAGRLVPVKNPTLLLRAAAVLKQEWGQRLKVVVAGDGPLRKGLEQLRTALQISDTVVLKGNLAPAELAMHYNAADATILTSHSEGTPNVLLESIACHTPFVAANVGGVSEIAMTGLDALFDDNDLAGLVAAVKSVVSRKRQPKNRDFEPSDTDSMAQALKSVFSRALQAKYRPNTAA